MLFGGESPFQALAEFSSLADSQGINSTEEARDMADEFIGPITTLKITKPQNIP